MEYGASSQKEKRVIRQIYPLSLYIYIYIYRERERERDRTKTILLHPYYCHHHFRHCHYYHNYHSNSLTIPRGAHEFFWLLPHLAGGIHTEGAEFILSPSASVPDKYNLDSSEVIYFSEL